LVMISPGQAVLLYLALEGATQTLHSPALAGSLAKEGSWVSVGVASLAALPILVLFLALRRRFPAEDWLSVGERVLGRFLGRILALGYAFYFLELGALALRQFNIFLTTDLLPRTPPVVPMILMIVLSASAVRNGLEVIGRLAELFVPFSFLFTLTVMIVHADHFRLENLKPWLGAGWGPVLGNSLTTLPWLGLIAAMGLVNPSLTGDEKLGRHFLLALLGWGLFHLLFTLVTIGVFGAQLASRLSFPGYSLAERVRIGGFFEGVDLLLFVVWVTGLHLELSFFYLLATLALARFFGLKNYRRLVLPVGVFFLVFSQILAENTAQIQAFRRPGVFLPFNLLFQLVFPLLLLLVAWVRGVSGARPGG